MFERYISMKTDGVFVIYDDKVQKVVGNSIATPAGFEAEYPDQVYRYTELQTDGGEIPFDLSLFKFPDDQMFLKDGKLQVATRMMDRNYKLGPTSENFTVKSLRGQGRASIKDFLTWLISPTYTDISEDFELDSDVLFDKNTGISRQDEKSFKIFYRGRSRGSITKSESGRITFRGDGLPSLFSEEIRAKLKQKAADAFERYKAEAEGAEDRIFINEFPMYYEAQEGDILLTSREMETRFTLHYRLPTQARPGSHWVSTSDDVEHFHRDEVATALILYDKLSQNSGFTDIEPSRSEFVRRILPQLRSAIE